MTTKTKQPDAVTLLLSDARGVYIPRDFVQGFDLTQWEGIDPADAAECANGPSTGPSGDFYWEAWHAILDGAYYTDAEGNTYRLYQDGDLWALCYERMTAEERRNFGMDEEQ